MKKAKAKKRGGPQVAVVQPKPLGKPSAAELNTPGNNTRGVQGRVKPDPANVELAAWLVDANGRIRFGKGDHGNVPGGSTNNFRFNFSNVKAGNSYYILVVEAADKSGQVARVTRQIVVV